MIPVKNIRNAGGHAITWSKGRRVDRSTAFGNPYTLDNPNDDDERDRVCDLFEAYFYALEQTELRAKVWDELRDAPALWCWCAPKRCHAQTIAAYIETRRLNALYLNSALAVLVVDNGRPGVRMVKYRLNSKHGALGSETMEQ